MELNELKQQLELRLSKAPVSSRVFLDRFRLISESSRLTSSYCDSRYAPFYYYLGCEVKPKRMVEVGFRLGLLSGCFLMGCKTVDDFLAFQQETDDFYSPRLGKANIRDNYKGKFDIYVGNTTDPVWDEKIQEEKWDIVFINEELDYDTHMAYLDMSWRNLRYDGMIVMDYVDRHEPSRDAYDNFCKVKQREPVKVNTRYGVGLVKR